MFVLVVYTHKVMIRSCIHFKGNTCYNSATTQRQYHTHKLMKKKIFTLQTQLVSEVRTLTYATCMHQTLNHIHTHGHT